MNFVAHPNDSFRAWNIITGGATLHLGMILVFVFYRYFQSHLFPQTLNVEAMSSSKAVKFGIYYFLASFPLVWLTGLCWVFILECINKAGWEIPLDLQPLVGIFEETKSPLALALLFIMAILIAPIAEELVFRAGIYRFFKSRVFDCFLDAIECDSFFSPPYELCKLFLINSCGYFPLLGLRIKRKYHGPDFFSFGI